jgi:hypothetical protein
MPPEQFPLREREPAPEVGEWIAFERVALDAAERHTKRPDGEANPIVKACRYSTITCIRLELKRPLSYGS